MTEYQRPRRPASIWIAQIVMLFFGLMFLSIPITLLITGNSGNLFATAVAFGGSIVFAAFPLAAFYGMAIRHSWGRVAAIVLLSLMILNSIITLLWDPNMFGPESRGFKIGYLIGNFFPVALLGWLVIVLIKSDAVVEFFKGDPQPSAEPPPIEAYE